MRQERMEQEAKEQELDTVFEVGVLGSEVRPACVAAQCLLITSLASGKAHLYGDLSVKSQDDVVP